MRVFWFGLFWLAGIALLICGGAVNATHTHQLSLSLHALRSLTIGAFAAESYLTLFVLAFCFDAVPGRRRRPRPVRYGALQGIWVMLAFFLMLGLGALLLVNVLAAEQVLLIVSRRPGRVDFTGTSFLSGCVVSGEVLAALWVAWYFARLGPARVADGSARGVAWRPASWGAYSVAALCAAGITALVLLMFRLIPPDMSKLEALPMAKLYESSGVAALPFLAVALIVGPALEELVFRGLAFGGLAARFGPGWAGIVTTLVVVGAHAPEKIYYPPGFIDVALLAVTSVWLRLKYRSIRPGILLHILYNAGSLAAAAQIV